MGTLKMTMPDERYNAVIRTEQFLKDLCDPKKTPRVPKEVREQAYYCLRHYPSKHHMDVAGSVLPNVFESRDKLDELSLLLYGYEEKKNARTVD
jgi:hypothetical protein